MCSRNRYALGAVNGAAATYRDQTVTLLRSLDLCGSSYGRFGGVGWRLVKYCMRQAAKRIDRFLQDACRFDTSITHDQRFADANTLAFLAQQLYRTEVELNLRDVIDKGHGLISLRKIESP